MIDQYHVSFMVEIGMVYGCIASSLMMCSGQGVVVQRGMKEKECVVEDIRNKSSHSSPPYWQKKC